MLTDLNNDGQINESDQAARVASYQTGANSEAIEQGTEYCFINDNLSNGAGDRGDPSTTNLAVDDDCEAIKFSMTPATGILRFNHPAIANLEFFYNVGAFDKIPMPFDLSTGTLPATIYVRAKGLDAGWAGQVAGDLVALYKPEAAGQERELTRIKLTIVESLGDEKFFVAARDYILERNTKLCVKDKGFPEHSATPSTHLRLSILREEGTVMKPYEAYKPNYDLWLSRGSPGDFNVVDHHTVAGMGDLLDLDNGVDLVINGNLCDFSSGISAVEAAALSLTGTPLMTDRCHGKVKELNLGLSPASSTHFDSETNAPGTHMKGHRFAGPDPLPGSVPPVPGGKHIAQYDDFHIHVGTGLPEDLMLADNPQGFTLSLTQFGGLATNYEDPVKDSDTNQMIGFVRLGEGRGNLVFTASDLSDPTEIAGYIPKVYDAAKRSGVADLDGATHVAGTLKPIELFLLDAGTSVSLAYRNYAGNLVTAVSESKNVGFPYFINTFLRFTATKPRP